MSSVMDEEAVAGEIILFSGLDQWQCCSVPSGSTTHPDQLEVCSGWMDAPVPGTVVSALTANGQWDFDHPLDIDASDWWYRSSFDINADESMLSVLKLEGLATLADVWLNGELILTTDNMFRAYQVDVSSRVRWTNQLAIRFRSLSDELKRKRPRPRWKTNLVSNQQLRWHRTTLQGRIPGWSPPAPAIGPWRRVDLEVNVVHVDQLNISTRLDGTRGVISIEARIRSKADLQSVSFCVENDDFPLQVVPQGDTFLVRGEVSIPDARTWSPHTHGTPNLYQCELLVASGDSLSFVECPAIGFRTVEVDRTEGFQVRVNGQPVYCRGACWTVSDILDLTGTEDSLRHDLTLARDAGVNMLRVSGTMVYESNLFYRLCDELGLMVWQDFMFANMDYPVDDEDFLANVTSEITQQLSRLAAHPCVAVYCGNSEIEQQASMLGMPRELWTNTWFSERLPALCREHHPEAIYVPSTPTGGVLPFQGMSGLTHYYGVGAYLRPVSDVRRTDVKFSPETMGFANIPDAATVDAVMGGGHVVMHDSRWKRRVPRDTGAGWDFDDVRDHYLRELFAADPVRLRSSDMPRYLQLSRLVPGEMMQQVYAEWRSGHSHNGGGLVWFYKDLWPGAGWGIVDSTGTPKATYYYLKRSWASRQLTLTDEGLNGIHIHLVNEREEPCGGSVEVTLLKEPNVIVARQQMDVTLPGRSKKTFSTDEVLGGFYDVSYAYRFGPAHHDVVIVNWYDQDRNVISEGTHFIGRSQPPRISATIEASAERLGDSEYRVDLQSDRFLHAVQLTARGYLPDDNYFHLPPQRQRSIVFRARSQGSTPFKVLVEALNLESSHMVSVKSSNSSQ